LYWNISRMECKDYIEITGNPDSDN
ncbi:hypothetical protein HMPREF0491_02980, partial [Lachnospiraceae oral taxon 107 str. F0167]